MRKGVNSVFANNARSWWIMLPRVTISARVIGCVARRWGTKLCTTTLSWVWMNEVYRKQKENHVKRGQGKKLGTKPAEIIDTCFCIIMNRINTRFLGSRFAATALGDPRFFASRTDCIISSAACNTNKTNQAREKRAGGKSESRKQTFMWLLGRKLRLVELCRQNNMRQSEEKEKWKGTHKNLCEVYCAFSKPKQSILVNIRTTQAELKREKEEVKQNQCYDGMKEKGKMKKEESTR